MLLNDHVLFKDLKRAIRKYRDSLLEGKDPTLKTFFEKAYADMTGVKNGKPFSKEIKIVQSWAYTQEKCFGP